MRLNEVALDMETFEMEKIKMEKMLESSMLNNHKMISDFKAIKLISKGAYGYDESLLECECLIMLFSKH